MLFKLVILLIFCVLERNPAEARSSSYTPCDPLSEKCVSFRNCINSNNMRNIKHCASRSLCCPVPKRPKADTPSSKACLNYANDRTFCQTHLYISRSNETNRHELQYMAHIGQKDETGFNYTWDCGGTVIHSKFVLTAAHCVIRERLVGTKEKDLVVRLGAHNTTDGDVYEVANKIPHPDYDEKTYANDIALLELTKTVVFNDQVRPACLTTSSGEEYDNMTVSGWGRYSRNKANDQAPELRKAELKLFKFSECPDVPQEMYICAGGDKNGSDSCDGDSGGPLARWHQEWGSCLGQVFAVVSRGSYCHTTSPRSKYTKVFYYLQWIENVVWPVTRENTD